MVEHYKGSKLPADEFVRNVLETKFGLDPRTHDDFLDIFLKNCRYLGIGADWTPSREMSRASAPLTSVSGTDGGTAAAATPSPPTRETSGGGKPVCFVAMPFTEKTEEYAPGFFTEVYASLFEPAIVTAGFDARTARGQGSDVIHSTIVNGLLDADLVLVDLTEHNPNVLFELGLRIAAGKPTVLVKAIGTNPIFDVDNLMRVVSYNPNLWPSTVRDDLPALTEFIRGRGPPRTRAVHTWRSCAKNPFRRPEGSHDNPKVRTRRPRDRAPRQSSGGAARPAVPGGDAQKRERAR